VFDRWTEREPDAQACLTYVNFELQYVTRKWIKQEQFMRSLCVYIQKFEIGLNLQGLKNGMGSSEVHGVYLNEQLSYLEMNQWMRNPRLDFVSSLLQSECKKIIYIATGYGLDSRGVGVRVPVGTRFFSSPRHADPPTQPPIQWVLGALSPGVKRPEREADHSPTRAEVKNDH
jgi:hypothetical protein